jgi:hypothetical protein
VSRLTFFCDLAEATTPLPHFWEHTIGSDHARTASPTFPLPPESYEAWTRTYQWKSLYGHEFLYAGPLFIHHLSHMWIDFRGIQDEYMRGKAINYFENSRRAIYAQQAYAMRNPKKFVGYDRFRRE